MMQIIKVQCVAQEYWILARMNCHCGGRLHARSHHASRSARLLDLIVAECQGCGGIRRVQFDTSSFRGSPYESVLRHVGLTASTQSERQWLHHISSTPMERTLAYIGALATSGDELALEYLTDVLSDARARVAPAAPVARDAAGSAELQSAS